MGDVWAYPPFKKGESVNELIPFHKLSQWLTYSLIEPLIEVGLNVTRVEQLTPQITVTAVCSLMEMFFA